MDFRVMLGAAVAVAGTLAIGAPAQAGTAFDNFAAGNVSDCCSGDNVESSLDSGMTFTSSLGGAVDEIDLALSLSHLPDVDAVVSLWTNNFGAELGHWQVTPTDIFSLDDTAMVSITRITGVQVQAGQTYVLDAVGVGGALDVWNANTTGSVGDVWQNGVDYGSGPLGAFRVLVAVPEPTTWAMMLIGFGALGAAVRARRTAALAA